VKRKPKGKSWGLSPERPAPAPEAVRQENGREVKVYPKRYADGYRAQHNVRPKETM
jgi:hypothetical protein